MRSNVLRLSLLLLLVGCGAAQSDRNGSTHSADLEKPADIVAEPIQVTATNDNGVLRIDAYSAKELFEGAGRDLRAGDCERAIGKYRVIVDTFHQSPYAAPALYNSGICSARLGRFEAAAVSYLELANTFPASPDITDALFQAAAAFEKIPQWNRAADVFARLLTATGNLDPRARVEALARQGNALLQVGKLDEAIPPLRDAVAQFRMSVESPGSASTYYLAMARFSLGEVVQARMRAVLLDGAVNEDELRAALERKCQLLLEAQREYSDTIRVAHPHWAAAAAYRIGDLYRNLWNDLTAAPPPAGLDAERQEVYAAVLHNRVRVLLLKAIGQWERTQKMTRRLALASDWATRTDRDLEEIRALLLADEKVTAAALP